MKDDMERVSRELLALKSRESTILKTELSANQKHIADLEREREDLKSRVSSLEEKCDPRESPKPAPVNFDEKAARAFSRSSPHETSDTGADSSGVGQSTGVHSMPGSGCINTPSGEAAIGAQQAPPPLQSCSSHPHPQQQQQSLASNAPHHIAPSNVGAMGGPRNLHTPISPAVAAERVRALQVSYANPQIVRFEGRDSAHMVYAQNYPPIRRVPHYRTHAENVVHFQSESPSDARAELRSIGLHRHPPRAMIDQSRPPHAAGLTIGLLSDSDPQRHHPQAYVRNRPDHPTHRVLPPQALEHARFNGVPSAEFAQGVENDARRANAASIDTTVLESSYSEANDTGVGCNRPRACEEASLPNVNTNSEVSARLERLAELSAQLLKMSEDE